MHKAITGVGAIFYAYYVWVENNLGNALWVLLAVIAINFAATIYTKENVRDIPQNLANYAISISATVFAQSHYTINSDFVKVLIILLMFHEISVSAPVVLLAMKKLGFKDDAQNRLIVQTAEQYAEQRANVTAADNKMNDPLLPPETGTGR